MSEEENKGKAMKVPALAIKNTVNILVYKIVLVMKWLFDVVIRGFNVLLTLLITVLRAILGILRVFVQFLPSILAKFIPKKNLGKTRQSLVYAGIEKEPEEVISILTVYSMVFGAVGLIVTYSVASKPIAFAFLVGILASLAVWVAYAMILNMLIYRRTESVEAALPDLLEMIAQNMITGMTVYNSLWSAARPEFGPVAEEIQSAARLTLTGVSLDDALYGITDRVKSDKLERAIKLIVGGMKSGGELPSVLQGVSQDMRAERNLRKQMAAETSAYALFIMFTIFVGTPLLFSISHQFMTIFNALFEVTGISELISSGQSSKMPGGGMVAISKLAVSPSFFMKYAVATIFVLAFFGAFLIGLIKTGKPISGLSNMPFMVAIALGVFFLIDYALGVAFSGMLKIS